VRAGSEPIAAAAVVAIALGLGLATAARAQPSASGAATLSFDKGRALMKEKKYAEACAAFEQSQKLDPQIGTLYNLGACYAQLGKIASAWTAYREVGQRDTNAGRKKEANRRAKELEPKLPKLLLAIAPAPPGLAVAMNGIDVTGLVGTETPVDPAEYKLKATAPGYAAWETTAKIGAEGKTFTIAIELRRPGAKEPIKPAPAKPAPAAETKPAASRPTPIVEPRPAPAKPAPAAETGPAPALAGSGSSSGGGSGQAGDLAERSPTSGRPGWPRRKQIALALGIGGAASLATGFVFGSLARGKWNDARALCGGDAICDDPATLAQGNALVDDARMRANLSTGLVLGGAVLLGAGAALWLTAPSPRPASDTALRIAPQLGPSHAGVMLGGRFR
jgi:hypothetical protein